MSIRQVLDASTAHLTAADLETLSAASKGDWGKPVMSTMAGPHGFLVHACRNRPEEPQITDTLWELMQVANSRGCDYLLLDRDAPAVEGLEVFEEDPGADHAATDSVRSAAIAELAVRNNLSTPGVRFADVDALFAVGTYVGPDGAQEINKVLPPFADGSERKLTPDDVARAALQANRLLHAIRGNEPLDKPAGKRLGVETDSLASRAAYEAAHTIARQGVRVTKELGCLAETLERCAQAARRRLRDNA